MKNQIKKSLKQSLSNKQTRDNSSQREGESDKDADKKAIQKAPKKKSKTQIALASKKSALIVKKSNRSIKRKKTKDDDKNCDTNLVTKKRMASLNASAILAANYEIENYAAKHESSTTETSDNSDDDERNQRNKIVPPTMKKEKKDVKLETAEEVNCVRFASFSTFCSRLYMPLFMYLFYSILHFSTFLYFYDIHADVIDVDVNLNLNQLDRNIGVRFASRAEFLI